ncbi:MAG: hypothetical protein Q9186_005812 [Xanthomendoza sp. 1 TL-2023]
MLHVSLSKLRKLDRPEMPYLYFISLHNTPPLLHQQAASPSNPTFHRRSPLNMPITDPTFQHSDEDWTQITQPRLRKRVQNRVSQRKHRSKVRQQRADSIDAERAFLAPSSSVSSRSSSNPGGQQHGQRDHEYAQHFQAKADGIHHWNASEELEYNTLDIPDYVEPPSPWLDYPASSLPMTSSYSIESPSIAATHAYVGSSSESARATTALILSLATIKLSSLSNFIFDVDKFYRLSPD